MLLVNALPAAMTVMLRGLARDWWDDKEDKDEDGFVKKSLLDSASALMGTNIATRELGGMLSGYGYSGPAVTKPIKDTYNLKQQIGQGDLDPALLRSAIEFGGSMFSLPSGQLWASGSGLWQWIDNPSLDIRAPIFGPAPQRR
jgi:hypothetical protein